MHSLRLFLLGVLCVSLDVATAQQYGQPSKYYAPPTYGVQRGQNWEKVTNDNHLVQALNSQKNVTYLEAGSLLVVQLLPDDMVGLKHQKFVTRTSNGKVVQVVYNLDMCERVPIKVGDVVSVGGEFIWTNQGGLLHWVHKDPKGNRKDGYVENFGKFYCR